jgi:hypothetical protein
MNFEYQTINSNRFRKYKQIRYIIYIVLIAMLFLLVPKRRARYIKGDYFNLADMLGLNVPFVLLVTILLAVAALYLHFYSLKTQNIGQVCIDEKGIKLNVNNSLQNFDFNDIKGLKIERGSTWHYAYKKDNYLITFDNCPLAHPLPSKSKLARFSKTDVYYVGRLRRLRLLLFASN